MAINPKIKQKAEDIRSKIFGSEVRESLASGIEAISEDVEATIGRQGYVEEQFQDVLDETTGKDVISAPELIAARNGKSNLKTRLDDEHAQVTAQLQQTEQSFNAQLAQKVSKGNVSVSDINKNLGKFDQTFMTEEFLQQMAGSTPINATPADDSVTIKKLANKSVASVKLDSFLAEMLYEGENLNNVPTDLLAGTYYTTSGELASNGISAMQSTGLIPVETGLKYTADNIYLNQEYPDRTSAITWFDEEGNFVGATSTPDVITNGYGIAPDDAVFARFIYYTDISGGLFVYEYDKAINNRIGNTEQIIKEQLGDIQASTNLFDGTLDLEPGTIYSTHGSLYTDFPVISQSTGLIPVESGLKYTADNIYLNQEYPDRTSAITWFDGSGNFVGATSTPDVITNGYGIAPDDAMFARFVYYTDISETINVYRIDGIARRLDNVEKESANIKEQLSNLSETVGKRPYQSGNIYFSVNVNQDFADIDSITNTVNDGETFASVPGVLKLPSTYTATGKPTKLVMGAHGAGSYVTSSSAPNFERWGGLVDNGYAVFDVNGSGSSTTTGQHVSGIRALEAYFKAYQYLIEKYNFEPTILVTGASMGGITALNFANRFEHIVDSVGVLYPVTDLYTQGWLNPWSGDTKKRIAEEYNFDDQTGNTFEEDKVIGLNPINNNSFDVNGTGYSLYPKPLKIWHGTADTVVTIDKTQELVQKIKNMGGQVDLRIIDGVGHTQPDIFIDELVLYFNRFVNKS